MTPEQKQMIKESWASVAPISDTAAELFYGRLFEEDPQLRSLFAGADMKEQGKKLMQTLMVVVAGIDKLENLVPAIQNLGRRHAGYRVRDEHYATVGSALIWTLEKGLGEAFTPAVRQAWVDAYTLIASVMKDAMAAPMPTPTPA